MNALGLFTEQSFSFSKLLIDEKGADLKIKTFSGNNCFHQLAMINLEQKYNSYKFHEYEKYLELKKQYTELYKKFFNLFVSNGIDINEKNHGGHTALSIALNEGNCLFLEMLTQQENLQVDRLVHEKSELHNFKHFVFHKKAPEILLEIIKKSKDFNLLLQLYDMDTGYNAFHDILNHIVTYLDSHLNGIRNGYAAKYQNYLRLVNNRKSPLFEREEIDEDFDDQDIIEEESEGSNKIDAEGSDFLEKEIQIIQKNLNKLKKKMMKKANFEITSKYLKVKSELYQFKYQGFLTCQKKKQLKKRIIEIFKIFEDFGYDLKEKVRLYKKKVTQVSVVEKGKQNMNRLSKTAQTSSRIRWKNKNYTINKEAKNTVFHILMKRANTFLFDFFQKKIKIKKNECNFLGYSLIHYLVKNYNASVPKMDVKVHNKEYNYEQEMEKLRGKKKEKAKETKPQTPQGGLFGGGNSGLFSGGPFMGQKRKKVAMKKTAFKSSTFGSYAQQKQASAGLTNIEAATHLNTQGTNHEEETVKVINRLLEFKENPNLPSKLNEFPIIKVCTNGGSALLHILVQNNINLNVLDKKGNTPLLIFAKRRDLRSCEYLLENKAEISLKDHKGRNALHWSLNQTTPENSNNFDLEEILIDRGIQINEKDNVGRPPIFYLFTKIENEFINEKLDPIEIFSYMISFKQMDLEQVDYLGNRLIHYLAQRGAYLCMIYLLREKVSINVLNNHGNSALNISIMNQQNDVAIILLQSNAEVNKSIQIVDYKTMKRYEKYQKLKEKKETEETKKIEEEEDEVEEEKLELEDESGFIKERVLSQFKENEESDDDDEWRKNVKMLGSKKKGGQRVFRMEEEEDLDYVVFENNQNTNQRGFGSYNYGRNFNMYDLNTFHQNTWMINQVKRELKQTIQNKLEDEKKWKNLEKMAKKDFITEQGSQFKMALRKNMLSVNFLLVDFKFNLGQAIMDTISIKNWDYTKTLLNKKMKKEMFQTVDNKGRNAMHYLANFGKSLSKKDLEYFLEKFQEKGITPDLADCLKRKPIHYAALNGNMQFINALQSIDKKFNQKDVFGNTLLSLYLKGNSVSRDLLQTFVNEFDNDVNLKFVTSSDDFIKEVESFDFWSMERKELEKKLKKKLKQSAPKVQFFEMELKLREGQEIPEVEDSGLKSYSNLLYAAWVKQDLVLTENLIEFGADINLQDEMGETLLSKAIKENKIQLLEILKKYSDQIDFTKGIKIAYISI